MISSISSGTNYWYQQSGNSVTDLLVTAASDTGQDTDTLNVPETSGDISAIDADGDGTISSDEYQTMISQMGLEYALSAEKFFSLYDTDGDGEISSEEMNARDGDLMTMSPPPMGSSQEESEISDELLSQYDTDGDGELSAEELEAMKEALSSDLLSKMESLASNTIIAYESNYRYMFENKEENTVDSIA